jgi:hypothetical protein
MRFKSIIAAALIGTTLFTSTGCKDDFSDTNTDPSVINKGISVSFHKRIAEF